MSQVSLKQKVAPWWLTLLEGIAAVIVGAFILLWNGPTYVFLMLVVGAYILMIGVLSIVKIYTGVETVEKWTLLFNGIVGILLGICVLSSPLFSTFLIPRLVNIVLIVTGILLGGSYLFQGFRGAGWKSILLGGFLLLMGIILIASPLITMVFLPLALGLTSFVGGILLIIAAFNDRSQQSVVA